MRSKKRNWLPSESDKEYSPWVNGFTSAELIDNNASGSSSLGQIADLVNSDVRGDWLVSSVNAQYIAPMIHRAEIGAGWGAVKVVFNADDLLLEAEQISITAEKIELIRSAFGFSVSQLAKILRTSRTSVYAWIDGEEPRERTMLRVEQIYQFAKYWSDMNPYHFSPGPVMRQKLGNSPSMLEQLEQEILDVAVIEQGLGMVLELMHRKHERMHRASQRTGKAAASDSVKRDRRHALTSVIGSSD